LRSGGGIDMIVCLCSGFRKWFMVILLFEYEFVVPDVAPIGYIVECDDGTGEVSPSVPRSAGHLRMLLVLESTKAKL
jgi:hypothetical protein